MKTIKNLYYQYKEIIMSLIMGVLTTLVNWVVYAVTVRALPVSGEVTKVAVANVIAWIAGVRCV